MKRELFMEMTGKTFVKRLSASALTVVLAAGMTACSALDTGNSTSSKTENSAEDVMHIVVAGTPGYEPFTYVGEDGNETGFDIEVMRAIDEIAPEIECEFTYGEWDTLMPGLDAGRFDVICGQLSKTKDREEMYTLESIPLNIAGSSLITTTEHSDWNDFEDLDGAVVECIVGSTQAAMVEKYLEEHPGAFTVKYTESALAQVIEDIANGRADATFEDGAVARRRVEITGLQDVIYVGEKLFDQNPVYYLTAGTEEGQKIADIIDKYLPELYYNGTLSELAIEFTGDDAIINALQDEGYYTETTLEEYREAHE